MGLINDTSSIWSKSGSGSGSFIDKALGVAGKVTDTINLVTNIFSAAKEHKAVITDYRKASVHLPKYYKVDGYEKVATLKLIDAVSSDDSDREQKGGSDWTDDLIDGNEKDTFLLKGVQEMFKERSQVVETFGDSFGVFFSGRSPSVFVFNGTLINDAYRNWKSYFIDGYKRYANGTECAKRKLKVQVVYDYVAVEGYILELSTTTDSSDDVNTPFTFTLLITEHYDYGLDEFDEAPTYGGQVGWSLESSGLSRFGSSLLSTFIPGLSGSGFEPIVGGLVDDVTNKFVSKSTSDKTSGRMGKFSDVYQSASGATALPGLVSGSFGAKSATSSSSASNTSSLLGSTSGSVSGKFGGMVNSISSSNATYKG